MKTYRRLLLAGLTVMIAAFGASASSASATVWKDHGVNVTKFSIGLSGGEVAEAGAKGLNCEVHATLALESGVTKITSFETKKCTGFGELAKCELMAAEAIGLPWTVDLNASDLTITGWHTKRTFKAGCATAEINKTVASVTVTLNSTTEITEVEFLGQITGYKTFGSLTVDAPNSGTYGIG